MIKEKGAFQRAVKTHQRKRENFKARKRHRARAQERFAAAENAACVARFVALFVPETILARLAGPCQEHLPHFYSHDSLANGFHN